MKGGKRIIVIISRNVWFIQAIFRDLMLTLNLYNVLTEEKNCVERKKWNKEKPHIWLKSHNLFQSENLYHFWSNDREWCNLTL